MLLETVGTSMIVAALRGGKLKNIEEFSIKAWYLFAAGLAVQAAPVYVRRLGMKETAQVLEQNFLLLHLLSYILIFTVLALNFRKNSIKLIFTGTLMNFIAIFSNGGYMPVSGDAIQAAGFHSTAVSGGQLDYKHILVSDSTAFQFLSDILPVPAPYPFPQILSVGDLFIMLGVFLLIQAMMQKKGNTTQT